MIEWLRVRFRHQQIIHTFSPNLYPFGCVEIVSYLSIQRITQNIKTIKILPWYRKFHCHMLISLYISQCWNRQKNPVCKYIGNRKLFRDAKNSRTCLYQKPSEVGSCCWTLRWSIYDVNTAYNFQFLRNQSTSLLQIQ